MVGTRAVKDLIHAIKRGEIQKITRQGWREDLQRAAVKGDLSTQGITPKMCRKTWVSWLMAIYPEDGLRIAASMGHDTATLIHHYLSLPFSNSERDQIRTYVAGWGGRN
jgi:integrase